MLLRNLACHTVLPSEYLIKINPTHFPERKCHQQGYEFKVSGALTYYLFAIIKSVAYNSLVDFTTAEMDTTIINMAL